MIRFFLTFLAICLLAGAVSEILLSFIVAEWIYKIVAWFFAVGATFAAIIVLKEEWS